MFFVSLAFNKINGTFLCSKSLNACQISNSTKIAKFVSIINKLFSKIKMIDRIKLMYCFF